MNEEVCCITNKGKKTKNTWGKWLRLSPHCIKKLGQFFFHTLLANLFKQRCASSVKSYKYLNKLISEAWKHLSQVL